MVNDVLSLYEACELEDLTSVKQILKKETGTDAKNEEGTPAFFVAISKGNLDCMELFINAGVDPNMVGKGLYNDQIVSALEFACWEGHSHCARALIDAGADVSFKDNEGWNALMYAVSMGSVECIPELAEAGANINFTDTKGWTPLAWAMMRAQSDCLKPLISAGADVNLANKEGWTPLMAAASNGEKDCVTELAFCGAEIDAKNKDGMTAADIAREDDHTLIADFLQTITQYQPAQTNTQNQPAEKKGGFLSKLFSR